MPAFTAYSRLQQENEGRREWGSGRGDQHRCHSIMKALQCWWAPAAASLSALARRHQLSDYTHGRYISHTKCASLVTDAQLQQPDNFNYQEALTS